MMKQFYIAAWILLAISAIATVLTGSFSPAILLVYSLGALALVMALAMWSVYVQTRDFKTE